MATGDQRWQRRQDQQQQRQRCQPATRGSGSGGRRRRNAARRWGTAAAAALFCWLAALAQLAPAAARVEIVTENPSPFAAVDPDAPKYVIGIFDDASKAPAAATEPSAGGPAPQYETMTAADGRRYNCTLPLPGAGTAAGDLVASQEPPVTSRTPFELLDPLNAICLYHKDATWTYEVCHRNRMKQFRQESTQRTEEFTCGAYEGDERQDETIREDTSASGRPIRYVVHRYGGGAGCHLTGRPRTAEVRYTCLRDTKDNVIVSVREFPTCNYVALVSTPLVCQHPAFRPPAEDLRLVSCIPLQEASAGGSSDSGGSGASAAAAGGGGGGSSTTTPEGHQAEL